MVVPFCQALRAARDFEAASWPWQDEARLQFLENALSCGACAQLFHCLHCRATSCHTRCARRFLRSFATSFVALRCPSPSVLRTGVAAQRRAGKCNTGPRLLSFLSGVVPSGPGLFPFRFQSPIGRPRFDSLSFRPQK